MPEGGWRVMLCCLSSLLLQVAYRGALQQTVNIRFFSVNRTCVTTPQIAVVQEPSPCDWCPSRTVRIWRENGSRLAGPGVASPMWNFARSVRSLSFVVRVNELQLSSTCRAVLFLIICSLGRSDEGPVLRIYVTFGVNEENFRESTAPRD